VLEDSITKKIVKVCTTIYGVKGVILTAKTKSQVKHFEAFCDGNLPVCIAKTQKSLSDNEKLISRPKDFSITIRALEIAISAGFNIPIAGNMLSIPALPVAPSL
jgi:formate--tetrahydrofolate ligase